jgi:tripartite ATP-independent transporter DctM subunit
MTAVLAFAFIGLMVLGAPIAFAMLAAGGVAVWMKPGMTPLVIMQNLFSGLDSFPLLAIPFFILAAELMSGGELTDVLLRFAARLVGTRRGGLGHANILTLTFFSGISGSALADAAGPGAMLIRMMKKVGYSDAYAAALTASTAIVGPIIPPSIIMIIYALTDNSVTVTGLFLAGVVPGLLIALALAVVNHVVSVRRGYRSPPELLDVTPVLRLFVRALPALMLPAIILGGIHFGIFTPTEASAAAVAYALVVGRFVYRTLRWDMLPAILFRTALMTASILFIVATSAVFAWVLTVGQIPQQVAAWITGLQLSPAMLLLAINVLLLLVGIFIEPLPGVMIMVPILAPLADAAGLNPLHFAIVVIVNLTLGMITPPVGGLLFVTSIVSGVKMGPMVREAKPMLFALLVVLALLTYVPGLSTWLPALLGYRH